MFETKAQDAPEVVETPVVEPAAPAEAVPETPEASEESSDKE